MLFIFILHLHFYKKNRKKSIHDFNNQNIFLLQFFSFLFYIHNFLPHYNHHPTNCSSPSSSLSSLTTLHKHPKPQLHHHHYFTKLHHCHYRSSINHLFTKTVNTSQLHQPPNHQTAPLLHLSHNYFTTT